MLFDSNDESASAMDALPHVSAIAAQLGKSASIDRLMDEVNAELRRRRIRSEAAGQEVY
jgi:hypothetical protein